MILLPAIDIKNGQVVRLLRGDYDRVTVYDRTPEAAAAAFAAAGAKHLHMVDLDGAKDGTLSNFETVRRVLESTGMQVEIGGGIRTLDRIDRYLEAGAARVILGTAALEDPAFLREALLRYGERIAVGVDAADGKVATHGWLSVTDTDSFSFCRHLADIGVKTVIYTDISKDGAESGTNLSAYEELTKIPGLSIIASGGITYYEELRRLSELSVSGAILGKALYTGAIDLKDSLKAAEEALA